MYRKLVAVFLLMYLCFAAVYWLKIGGANTIILRDTIYLIPPLIATVAGVFSLGLYGFHGSKSITLILLTFGMLCWLLGETMWYVYEFVLHTNPFPSTADIFYLLAYPIFFFALVYEIKSTGVSLKHIRKSLLFLFILTFLVFAVLVGYFGIYLAFDPKEALFTNLIAMGYGVGDLFLIMANVFVLVLAWEYRGGKLSGVWLSLFVGFIFTLIADILFAIFTIQYKNEVWFYKILLDSLWMLGYMLFGYGLFSFGFSILTVKKLLKTLPPQKIVEEED